MEPSEFDDIRRSIRRLEARNRRLAAGLAALIIVFIAGTAALLWSGLRAPKPVPPDGILKVRGLIVVDGRGVERVRIAAPLPDPRVLGKRFPRGGAISGVLLFDEEGNERSGYVTSDGHEQDGLARQHVLFMAEPQGDPSLMLWDGRSSFRLTVGADGPLLKISAGDKTLLAVPAEKPPAK